MKRKSLKLKKSRVKKSKSRRTQKRKSYSTTGIVLGVGIPVLIGLSGLGYYYYYDKTYKGGDIEKLIKNQYNFLNSDKHYKEKVNQTKKYKSQLKNKYEQLKKIYIDEGKYKVNFNNPSVYYLNFKEKFKVIDKKIIKDYIYYHLYNDVYIYTPNYEGEFFYQPFKEIKIDSIKEDGQYISITYTYL